MLDKMIEAFRTDLAMGLAFHSSISVSLVVLVSLSLGSLDEQPSKKAWMLYLLTSFAIVVWLGFTYQIGPPLWNGMIVLLLALAVILPGSWHLWGKLP